VAGWGQMDDLTADDIRNWRLDARWSIAEACREMAGRSPDPLPALPSLVRMWKRWEAGTQPHPRYQRLLHALFASSAAEASARAASPGSTTSSLTVWRRWLAFELRRLRAEAGLSRADVERACAWEPTKLAAVEDAHQGVTPDDLDLLLPLYRVPTNRWAAYSEAADNSRGLGWWQRYEERDLPRWHSLYVGLEQGASRLRAYEPQLVHGLLQTPDYAAAVIRRGPSPRADEQVARLVNLRATRQSALTRTVDPLEVWVVLDEAALRRVAGGAATMAAQLNHVADLADDRPNVTVQVLPFDAGPHGSVFGAFTILAFPWATDAGVAYGEYRTGAIYCEELREVEEHSLTFQQLCALALSPDESTRLLRDTAEEYARAPAP
jgi:hypothetical protein